MPGGRPRTCFCDVCRKCKRTASHRRWMAKQSAEKKREMYLAQDPEKRVAATHARFDADPEKIRKARREARARTRAKHPEKRKAQDAVGRAVRRGALERQPCEVCGNPRSQAHHDDYSRPLDVRWLCRTHHGIEHRRSL